MYEPVEDTIDWLRSRPYYQSQIQTHRVVPGNTGEYQDVDMDDRVATALANQDIPRLYQHQAEAITALQSDQNVVVSTPTASGKSLCYAVPAFERALNEGARTLYIAPQVALINDQEETLSAMTRDLGFGASVAVDQYTGRLSRTEKQDVRDRHPTFVLTTPDMLHYGILPHGHRLWDWFFESLDLVVIDEVHEYRGVFGSHVSLVLRRLNRVTERFAQSPQFICCSATIQNPRGHASALTNHPEDSFTVVDTDRSETGPTHWVFWNPPSYDGSDRGGRRRSNHTATKQLFVDLVARGYQTVVFTRARQAAERYATECSRELRDRGEHDLADSVTAYQAALQDDRRKTIEVGLQSGEIRGVWSTNALELGVDIGGLDVVLLDGYPGTRLATFQQAGRAGRGLDPSLVVLVGGDDQLDQYFMAQPTAFFADDMERAVVNPGNDELLPDHIACAARENWLSTEDTRHFGKAFPRLVGALQHAGRLEKHETQEGVRWTFGGEGSPQHEMSLRAIGDREITLLRKASGSVIGSLPLSDALRDVHPGAVYHHQGQTFEVVDLDLTQDRALLEATEAGYYTRVLHEKDIQVIEDRDRKALPTRSDVEMRFADIQVEKEITGFERRDPKTGEAYGRVPLDLPETTLQTAGLYFAIPDDVETAMRQRDGDFDGGIHAAEHGMIAMFPLELLCDRRDIGGLSTPLHPHTNQSTIFIYDGYPGGVGLTRAGYDAIGSLMVRTRDMIEACECQEGCPSCVHSPHCGNANEPLNKDQAVYLLEALVGEFDPG